MTQGSGKKVAILGAGLSGLRLGSLLVDKGFRVEIYEKNDFVGGLLQTIERGGFVFDLGPHILFEERLEFYRELLGSELLTMEGFFGIGYERKQIRSPIDPLEVIKTLRLGDSLPIMLDMATRMFVGTDPDMVESADEWATAKFGKRANECFFKYYIEKSTGVPSNKVSAHWGTERHRFYKEHNLWERSMQMLSRVLGRSERQPLIIHYPKNGVQTIAEKLGERIERAGGRIFLSASVTGLVSDGERVNRAVIKTEDGRKREVKADIFVSTLPITDLWKMLLDIGSKEESKAKLKLKYRSLWLFYFFINRPRLMDKVQIYFPEQRYFFKRVYEPKNLDPTMGDPNSTAVCVEVGYTEGDSISRMNEEKLAERLTTELCDFYGLDPSEFTGRFALKVPHSYPIYELGYVGEVLKAAKLVYSFANLFSIGRQGLFRYDYMTNRVMESADYLAKFLQTGKSKDGFLREPIAKALFF